MSTPEPVLSEHHAPSNQQTEVETGEFELTILMPCLNEAKIISTCIAKAH